MLAKYRLLLLQESTVRNDFQAQFFKCFAQPLRNVFFFPVFEIFDEALKSEIIAIAVLYCKCPCGIDSTRAP